MSTVQHSSLQKTSSTASNTTWLPAQYKRTGRGNFNTHMMKY